MKQLSTASRPEPLTMSTTTTGSPLARVRASRFNGWLWMLPCLLILGFTQIVPMVYAAWLSFYNKQALSPEGTFVGFDNYTSLVADPEFWHALWIGVVYAFGSVAVQVVVGLAGALLLHRTFRGRSIARALVILPYMMPVAATALIFGLMSNNIYGIINQLLVESGIVDDPIQFFGSTAWALPSVILVAGWCWSPFATIVFLSRLQTIDGALYECAATEGARTVRQFLDITLPSLRGAMVLVILLRGIWMFNKFDIPYLVTQGGPGDATTNLPVLAFETNFLEQSQGMGAALAIVMSLILLVVAIPYFLIFRPEREVNIE